VPNDVSTLAMGFAASMGQFLLTVGTAGTTTRDETVRPVRVVARTAGRGGAGAQMRESASPGP
ncbi:ATP-dependent Clp protease proteolytic subunit, partial [Streptomyces clavifer]